MARTGSVVMLAGVLVAAACADRPPPYTAGHVEDTAALASRPLEVRSEEIAAGVERLEVDLFLEGDVTEERAVMTLTRTLDSLRMAHPRATVLRAVGFVMDFGRARGERVPVEPVLLAEQRPVARDTLEVRRPNDVYRTHVTVFGNLPSRLP